MSKTVHPQFHKVTKIQKKRGFLFMFQKSYFTQRMIKVERYQQKEESGCLTVNTVFFLE